MRRVAGVVALLVLGAPDAGVGQIQAAVAATVEGPVRFSFATRDGVEICPRGIRWSGERWYGTRGRPEDSIGCAPGPAVVELRVREGQVLGVELLHGDRAPREGARDVGAVDAADAARFLLGLADGGASADAAEDALMPAFLARVPEVWRDMARLASDPSLSSALREAALFWLGQDAASAATEGIAAVASDEDEDQDVREAAVFALSQRPPDEGVPVLMDLARSADQAETRRAAFFWLAQIDDARVVGFFQDVLLQAPRR